MNETSVPALRIAVLLTVIGLSSIAHVYAQTDKGSLEVGIEAGPFLFIGGHEPGGGLSGEPHLNYFLTDELAVGVTGFFTPVNPSQFGAYGHFNRYFNSGSRLSPYMGARIGVLTQNLETLFGLGPQIGLKYFAARQFSINVQLDGAVHPESNGGAFFYASLILGLSYHIK